MCKRRSSLLLFFVESYAIYDAFTTFCRRKPVFYGFRCILADFYEPSTTPLAPPQMENSEFAPNDALRNKIFTFHRVNRR